MNFMEDLKMKEHAIQKINQMGKVGGIIITIAKVFCIIGLVLTLIGTIAVGCIPKNFVQLSGGGNATIEIDMSAINQSLSDEDRARINDGELIREGNVELSADGVQFDQMSADGNVITMSASGNAKEKISLHDLTYVLVMALVSVAMTVVSLFFAGFLCKAFKECESPFEENVIIKMRNFAYSLIPWVILGSMTESALTSVKSGRFDVNLSIDFTMLVIVLIILALVYIFKYGAILQQESDETL